MKIVRLFYEKFFAKDRKGSKNDSETSEKLLSDNENHSKDASNKDSSRLSEQRRKALDWRVFSILLACHVTTFLYSASYWVQLGAFPYLTKKLGVNPVQFGYLASVWAFAQLIGSPICGRFADIFGCRWALVLSFLSTIATFLLLAIAKNLPMLYLTRLPAIGIHGMQGAHMVVADITSEEKRADMIGKMAVSNGLGMIFGSYVGGVITEAFSEKIACLVAAAGTAACVVFVIIFIPRETVSLRKELGYDKPIDDKVEKELNESREMDSKKSSILSNARRVLRETVYVLGIEHIVYILVIQTMSVFPSAVFSSMFSIVIMDYYHLGPKANGKVLSYLGILAMVIKGGLVGIVTRFFSDAYLISVSVLLMAVGFLFMSVARDIYQFCLFVIPLVGGGAIFHIILLSLVTKLVPARYTGTALGVKQCTGHTLGIFSPALGGYIFTHIGFPAFGLLGYVINSGLALYLFFKGRQEFLPSPTASS